MKLSLPLQTFWFYLGPTACNQRPGHDFSLGIQAHPVKFFGCYYFLQQVLRSQQSFRGGSWFSNGFAKFWSVILMQTHGKGNGKAQVPLEGKGDDLGIIEPVKCEIEGARLDTLWPGTEFAGKWSTAGNLFACEMSNLAWRSARQDMETPSYLLVVPLKTITRFKMADFSFLVHRANIVFIAFQIS